MNPTIIDYGKLPAFIWEDMRDYIEHGVQPDSLLTAVLENNLGVAVMRAGRERVGALRPIMMFLHWEAPDHCYGSPERVAAWIAKGGLSGAAA